MTTHFQALEAEWEALVEERDELQTRIGKAEGVAEGLVEDRDRLVVTVVDLEDAAEKSAKLATELYSQYEAELADRDKQLGELVDERDNLAERVEELSREVVEAEG